MISVHFQGKPFNIIVIQVYSPTSNAEKLKLNGSKMVLVSLQECLSLLELTSKKDVLFITGDWNVKAGSQDIPGVTGKFGLGILNEAEQRLIEFYQENALVIANTLFSNNTGEDSTHGHHQMVNTRIRLIIFFAAEDGKGLYSQQKRKDQELTVVQTMTSLLPNSDLN